MFQRTTFVDGIFLPLLLPRSELWKEQHLHGGCDQSCHITRRAAKALPLQILANKLPGSARRTDSTQHHHVREMFPIKQEMMTRLEMKTLADDEVPNGFTRAWRNT